MFFRRVRGIAITALTWAVPWALLGSAALLAVEFFVTPPEVRAQFGFQLTWRVAVVGLKFFGIVGAISGALFASAVALGERRRTFGTLSTGRMLLWGALGGAALPLLVGLGSAVTGSQGMAREFVLSGIGAALGAGSAWAMLMLARRARDPLPPDQLSPGDPRVAARASDADPVRRRSTS